MRSPVLIPFFFGLDSGAVLQVHTHLSFSSPFQIPLLPPSVRAVLTQYEVLLAANAAAPPTQRVEARGLQGWTNERWGDLRPQLVFGDQF